METPALVIAQHDSSASPFGPSQSLHALLAEGVDDEATSRACHKLRSRIARFGAMQACCVHDEVWEAARMPLLSSVLARLMHGRLSYSEHRFFLMHQLVPALLRSGDAFVVFQEPALAQAALASPQASFTNRHKLLVFIDSHTSNTVNAQHCSDVAAFAGQLPLPSYRLDIVNCQLDEVHCTDAEQMARAVLNCAATYVMRPGGCVTALYYMVGTCLHVQTSWDACKPSSTTSLTSAHQQPSKLAVANNACVVLGCLCHGCMHTCLQLQWVLHTPCSHKHMQTVVSLESS